MKTNQEVEFVSLLLSMAFWTTFFWLAQDSVSRPTRIAELIPNLAPATNGACDAAASGMGGVHFIPTDTTEIPLLWRQPFPEWI